MPSYSPASPIRPKVRVVRRKRWERVIAVYLLKKRPGAAVDAGKVLLRGCSTVRFERLIQ